ncbi:MAG: hypothetical protein ABW022_14835 [Actinoplanes sp.]
MIAKARFQDIVEVGGLDGYDRHMKLTEFGWQVYHQHRLVIRRLDDAELARREAKASR